VRFSSVISKVFLWCIYRIIVYLKLCILSIFLSYFLCYNFLTCLPLRGFVFSFFNFFSHHCHRRHFTTWPPLLVVVTLGNRHKRQQNTWKVLERSRSPLRTHPFTPTLISPRYQHIHFVVRSTSKALTYHYQETIQQRRCFNPSRFLKLRSRTPIFAGLAILLSWHTIEQTRAENESKKGSNSHYT
jgi:hypothetical protein